MFLNRFLKILLMLLIAGFAHPFQSGATHIVGGELNYRYLGNNVYEINLTVYRDCYNGVPPFDNPASVGVFDALTNNYIRQKFFTFTSLDTVPPTVNSPCFIPPLDVCYEVTTYTDTLILPPSNGGYILAYQRCCRNMTILNIVTPNNVGATYEAWLAGTSTFSQNSNPVFNNWPPPFICAGIPFVFDHSAFDFEGDSIVYELVTPFDGATPGLPMPQPPSAPPYANVVFDPPYSQNDMLGGTPPLSIDPATGILTAFPTTIGQFVIGVRAREFRNGILVGYTRRDFQLNVVPCPTLVVAALQNPLIRCGSYSVTFQNLSINAGRYHWDFGVTSSTSDTSNLFSPTFLYPDTGVYTITLIAYSTIDPTCADTTIGTVTILPDFVPSFTYTIDTCSRTIFFNDTSNSVSGTSAQWNWNFGDGSTATISDPSHQYAASGNYPVTLIVTSSRGCIDTLRTTITIPPAVSAQISNTAVRCFGECNGVATANVSNGSPPYTYQWNDPLLQKTVTADSLCIGTYSVTVTDSRGCTTTGTVTITQPLPLSISLTSLPDYCGGICAGVATAHVAGGNGGYNYSWNDPQNQTTASATGLCPDTLTLAVTDQFGCTIQGQVIVGYVDSFPTVDATADTNLLYQGQSTSLHGIIQAGGLQFQWTPSGSLDNANVQDPVATPTSTTTYTVIATDANGCTAEDTVTIYVTEVLCNEPEIFIPSAFSPNNDQQNDILFIRGSTIEKVYLALYDRWGEKIFETNSTTLGWDGTYKGKLLPPDVYVYYVEATCYNKAEFRKKGNVTLIR
jgi:gliding motility-associated-like protein